MNEILKWIFAILIGGVSYLFLLWVGIVNALFLNPQVLEVVEQYPQQAGWVIGGIVFLAGVSTLLGESAVLFINRVRRGRFIISLITNGIVFIISYAVWGLTVYVIGHVLFSADPPAGDFIRMVGLSTAPLVFGFFILIPWMGPFIAKVLNIWSLVILIVIVEYEFKIGLWPAVLCVGLGWLASLAFTNTIGRPVVALRNKVFQMVTGSKLDSTTENLLLHFSGASYDQLLDLPVEEGARMITLLLIALFALIFVSAALAPMESLGWWAGWGDKPPQKHQFAPGDPALVRRAEADFYLVYLSGIGAISGTSVPAEEYPFIDGLRKRLPRAKVISDIYPYSVTNQGLTGERGFAWLWRRLEKLGQNPKNKLALMTMIINLRNAFQLFVSADRRYGPVYNLGVANEIYRGLLRNGMHPRSSKPIVLLGWSGGGQVAIGAVQYLAGLPGPIYVISVGGMLSDDPGLEKIDHLWHLYGVADSLQALGGVMFYGRWPLQPKSPWNEAMADGRIDLICLGQYGHNGKGNYFDMATPLTKDKKGRTHGQKTLDTIIRILNEEDLVSDEDAAAAWKMSVPKETDGVPEAIAAYMAEAAAPAAEKVAPQQAA